MTNHKNKAVVTNSTALHTIYCMLKGYFEMLLSFSTKAPGIFHFLILYGNAALMEKDWKQVYVDGDNVISFDIPPTIK